jgi:hypothetical protein
MVGPLVTGTSATGTGGVLVGDGTLTTSGAPRDDRAAGVSTWVEADEEVGAAGKAAAVAAAGRVRAGRPASGVLDLFGTEGVTGTAGEVTAGRAGAEVETGAGATGALVFLAKIGGAAGWVALDAAVAAATAATAEAAAAMATAALAWSEGKGAAGAEGFAGTAGAGGVGPLAGRTGAGAFSAEVGPLGGRMPGGSLSVAAAEPDPVIGGATREVIGFCERGIDGPTGFVAAESSVAPEAGGLGEAGMEGTLGDVTAGGFTLEVGGLGSDPAGGGVTDEVAGFAALGSGGTGIIRSVEGWAGGTVAGVTRTGRGGLARKVTANRCEAEGALSPVTGGERRMAGVKLRDDPGGRAGITAAGFAGRGGVVLVEVGTGVLPGSGGRGVILAVGRSPGTEARFVAAGRGGAVAEGAGKLPVAGRVRMDPVEGLGGRTVDPVRSGPVAGRTGPLSGKAGAGVAETVANGCCGTRVSGITTGPVRRGASGAGVRRSEAVGGRLLMPGLADGETCPVAGK